MGYKDNILLDWVSAVRVRVPVDVDVVYSTSRLRIVMGFRYWNGDRGGSAGLRR
jgi:hypothetical protein